MLKFTPFYSNSDQLRLSRPSLSRVRDLSITEPNKVLHTSGKYFTFFFLLIEFPQYMVSS